MPKAVPARFSPSCPEQKLLLISSAELFVCVDEHGVNCAPPKCKGKHIEAIIDAFKTHESPQYQNGISISQRTIEKYIPEVVKEVLARQEAGEKDSGNGDTADLGELESAVDGFLEAVHAQREKNELRAAMTEDERQEQEAMDEMATDVRQQGVAGLSGENRAGGRAAASQLDSSSRRSWTEVEAAGGDQGGEKFDAAQLYIGLGGDGSKKDLNAMDKLVDVLAASTKTQADNSERARQVDEMRLNAEEASNKRNYDLDQRRLDLDTSRFDTDKDRVEIERMKEERLKMESLARIKREKRQDDFEAARREREATLADAREERAAARDETMMKMMMQFAEKMSG